MSYNYSPIFHSHHVLTLLIGDKLYLAPLPKDILVCLQSIRYH